MLVVDEVMEREASLETRASVHQQLQCRCRLLEESKADVDLMSKRFISTFLWPFELASVGVSEAQEELVHNIRKQQQTPKMSYKRGNKRSSRKRACIKIEDGTDSTNINGHGSLAVPIKQEIKGESSSTPVRSKGNKRNFRKRIKIENDTDSTNINGYGSSEVPIKQGIKCESSSTPVRRSSRLQMQDRKSYCET